MIPAIKILFLKYRLIIYGVLAALSIAGLIYIKKLRNDVLAYKQESERYEANMNQYAGIANRLSNENKVLRLTVDDLEASRDSLTIKVKDYIKKVNKGKPAKPGDVSAGITTVINMTDTIEVKTPDICKIDTVVSPNSETSIGVNLDSGLLKISTKINNTETLYVHSKKEYKNDYKNGWIRFWNFDWKKKDTHRYDIENSNDLIEVSNIRVIKIEE